jgi:hypothetical protein
LLTIANFDHVGRTRERKLVEIVVAMNNPNHLGVGTGDHAGNLGSSSCIRHPQNLSSDMPRVSEGSKHVEHGGHSELGSCRANMTHRRVVCSSERKTQADFGDAAGNHIGAGLDVDTELLE